MSGNRTQHLTISSQTWPRAEIRRLEKSDGEFHDGEYRKTHKSLALACITGGFGEGKCAKYVRLALEAGGANTTGYPVPAKNYGPLLIKNGFRAITVKKPETFIFIKGDIVVIEPTRNSQFGHIAGFDGRNWISDFVQRDFWPGPGYRTERPNYVVYRI